MKKIAQLGVAPWIVTEFNTFNQQLGLTPAQSEAKLQHDVKSANIFQRSNPQVMADDILRGNLASPVVSSSPLGVLIGDDHMGNLGVIDAPDSGVPVFGVADTTKAGLGPIAYDIVRLASTTLTAAQADQMPNKVGVAAAQGAIQNWLSALTAYAQTGSMPAPYLTASDVASLNPGGKGAVGKDLLKLSSEAPATEVTKMTGSPTGNSFLKGSVQDPTTRATLGQVFSSYAAGIPGVTLQALDFAQRASSGGSNGDLVQSLVLALVTPDNGPSYRQVFEIKQLVPPPTETGSGDRMLANAQIALQERAILQGGSDPLDGAASYNGYPCLVLPLGDNQTLNVGKMKKKGLEAAAALSGALTACADEQTVSPSAVADWLSGQGSNLASALLQIAEAEATQSQSYVQTLQTLLPGSTE